DPGQFFLSPQDFHEANRVRAERFPHSLLATATHDHKRGEDARLRIAVLSETPDEWRDMVREWITFNTALRTEISSENGDPGYFAPQPADELMLYQMLVGAWPIGLEFDDAHGIKQFAERIERWLIKALREAKQVSDWVLPNEQYEAACVKFLHAILLVDPYNVFLSKLVNWAGKLTPAGIVKSLGQTVLRMTSPGIPDLYQGTDFWDFSLVDPDNRRPVDYAAREQALGRSSAIRSTEGWQQGNLKQQVIRNLLALRTKEPDLFLNGDYLPLDIAGPMADHAIAFARRYQQRTVIVIVTHLPYQLLGESETPIVRSEAWKETVINFPFGPESWTDIFSGEKMDIKGGKILLCEALHLLPVAVLMGSANLT
ncbi:MAG: malto-oligosyltrehalose synthase, partial [Burkholderiaceae bacterium]